jgi:hypothetical protein
MATTLAPGAGRDGAQERAAAAFATESEAEGIVPR